MKKWGVLSVISLLLGAILWNSWVFGWLDHGWAGYFQMSISELEALNQPYAALFNGFENISGVLLVIGALGAIFKSKSRLSLLSLILVIIGLIGALTLYDVAHPLDCNRYQNPACLAKLDAGHVSRTSTLHDLESTVTAYMTIVLALLVIVWVPAQKLPRSDLVLVIALGIGILVTLAILDVSVEVRLDAIAERLWNVLVSLDIGFVALRLQPLKLLKKA